MSRPARISPPGTAVRRTLLVAWALLAGAPALWAHGGLSLQAPLVATAPVIDGAIEQPLWGPDRLGAAAGCQFQHLFALRTATHYYVAVDTPETTIDAADRLVLFFDGNHNGTVNTDTSDRAISLVGFPDGANQTPTTAQLFSGLAGGGWGAAAALAAGEVRYTRTGAGTANGRMTIELRLPLTAAPTGFAFAYLTGDAQDCNGDFVGDPLNFKWPPLVPTPSATAPGLQDPSVWGDLGRRAPLVAFQPPTCCHSADIAFTQNGAINPQPFTAGVPVDITARVHNSDTAFDAKNVKVRVVVHDFGSGGVDVFDTSLPALPDDPVIGTIGTATSASTSPVTWPAPPAGLHGCIRTFLLPPGVGAGTSLDDYSVGAEASAQHNTDVACVGAGGNKQMMFKAFNPDDQDRKIVLVMQQRLPEAMKGLKLELLQPDRPLRPREVFQAALKLTAPAGLPATDLPHQAAHVPPTAGGPTGGDVAAPAAALVQVPVQPGARVHVMASGQVDTDGDGSAPPTGPDGRDAGPQAEGRYLLSGAAGRTVAGALIGSFDGFATSFFVGASSTFTVPEKAQVLSLAVNDVVGRHGDNTGAGFDVHATTVVPGGGARREAVAAPGPLGEVDVFATTTEEVTLDGHVYRTGRILGGVTYQVLVTAGEGGPTVPPVEPGKKPWWLLLLLLVIVAVGALFLRKKSASA